MTEKEMYQGVRHFEKQHRIIYAGSVISEHRDKNKKNYLTPKF
jgi:hypothetical protein